MIVKELGIDETLPLSFATQSKGTHVVILESSEYLKKYSNKINYLVIDNDGTFSLIDGGYFGNSKRTRLSRCHINSPKFFSNAIEGIHFKWISNSTIYDGFGEIVGVNEA